LNKNVESILFHQKIFKKLHIFILVQVNMFQKVLSCDLLAKIDFIAFLLDLVTLFSKMMGCKCFRLSVTCCYGL